MSDDLLEYRNLEFSVLLVPNSFEARILKAAYPSLLEGVHVVTSEREVTGLRVTRAFISEHWPLESEAVYRLQQSMSMSWSGDWFPIVLTVPKVVF